MATLYVENVPDELYDALIVRPYVRVANVLWRKERLLGLWANGSSVTRTTSGNITDDVILQYLQEHEPTGVSR